jgi:hypothetical protein
VADFFFSPALACQSFGGYIFRLVVVVPWCCAASDLIIGWGFGHVRAHSVGLRHYWYVCGGVLGPPEMRLLGCDEFG